MKNTEMKPWTKTEGLYVSTGRQIRRARGGKSYRLTFIPKHMLKSMSDFTDEEFEEQWADMKEHGMVKEALVKYDENGKMIDVYLTDPPKRV